MRVHAELVSVSLGIFSALAGGRWGTPPPSAVAKDEPVRWIGGAPTDDDARAVWETLARGGVTRYADVVEDVSERLFRRDLGRVGGAGDIGFLQPFYRRYAREVLARLEGRLLRIGTGATR
jgi:hypothetical protein